MISFTLFRVQVAIHPSLWVMLLLLSALFTGFSAGVPGVALFAVALFFCLLMHEMGQSLVGRCLGGGQPQIYLTWLGADSCNENARLTRTQCILMTAAGPLASLLPVVLIVKSRFCEGVFVLSLITSHSAPPTSTDYCCASDATCVYEISLWFLCQSS